MSQIQETSTNLNVLNVTNVIKIAEAERAADLLALELAAQRELLLTLKGKNSLFSKYKGYAASYQRLYASENELPFEPSFITWCMHKFKVKHLCVKKNIAESRLLLEKSNPKTWNIVNNKNPSVKYSVVWSVNNFTVELSEVNQFLADPYTEYKTLQIQTSSSFKAEIPISYAEVREDQFIFVSLDGRIFSCDSACINLGGTGANRQQTIERYAKNVHICHPTAIDHEWSMLKQLK